MSEELLVNVTPRETRVAVVENGMLQELHIERGSQRGVVGNIYKGKVQRVMPGMQAAFVDIGLDRAAFLHANDIFRSAQLDSGEVDDPPSASPMQVQIPITELLRDGAEIVVQVVKDPIGSKGARLTTQISIPSRYMVLLPHSQVMGVSARIEDEDRACPPEDLDDRTGAHAGRRTATSCAPMPKASRRRRWPRTSPISARVGLGGGRFDDGEGRRCVYEDLSLPLRAVRDLMRRDVEKVKVDSRETCDRLRRIRRAVHAGAGGKIEHYSGARPIFDMYGVEDEIDRALEKEVPLKSGGYLVIDQTEAMTTIDVNTGSFLGQRNLEETVYRTNLEAAQSVARPAAPAQPGRDHHHRLHRHGWMPSIAGRCCARWRKRLRATTPRPRCTTSRRSAWWR